MVEGEEEGEVHDEAVDEAADPVHAMCVVGLATQAKEELEDGEEHVGNVEGVDELAFDAGEGAEGHEEDDGEGEVQGADREPVENQGGELVQELDPEHELARPRVRRVLGDAEELGDVVDEGEEGTVQPAAALLDELENGAGDISVGDGSGLVVQGPVAVALGHKLKAEHTILSEVHVGHEGAHVLDAVLLHEKVVVQGRPLDGLVAVGREGTRQHRNVAKHALHCLVQDMGNFVLKVLGCLQHVVDLGLPHGNLASDATNLGVLLHGHEKLGDGLGARLSTNIKQKRVLGVQLTAKASEEPQVGVELATVLLLEGKHQLHGLVVLALCLVLG
mmetsp:Transcript_24805/g.44892  ORF Transcript_24805/g.44892 Transcript_24805/m.44892 type:complete len:333 (+) Transcript_24805:1481-2479(+)